MFIHNSKAFLDGLAYEILIIRRKLRLEVHSRKQAIGTAWVHFHGNISCFLDPGIDLPENYRYFAANVIEFTLPDRVDI